MSTSKHTFILLLGLALGAMPLAGRAQIQVKEDQVKLEELLVDASREKLVGNYTKAVELLQEILKKDKRNAAVAYELARVYEAMGDEEKAVRYIKNAIEWEPDNPWLYHFQVALYQKNNRNKDAAETYRQISRLEPNNPNHYLRWAYFLVRANELSAALKVYDEAEKKFGLSEEIIRHKHSLYVGLGDDKKAARELERLIEAFPSEVEYRYLLASFYEQTGSRDKALEVYRNILKVYPSDAKAQLALAGTGTAAADELLYLQSLEPIFRQAEVHIDLKIGKLLPFIHRVADTGERQLADAALHLTAILHEVHPEEAKGYSAAGDLLYYSGRRLEALQQYQKTLELDDTVFLVWEQVLHIYAEEKNYPQLLRFSDRAMDFFPNQAMAYYMYGAAANELGKNQDALSVLQQALMIAANNAPLKLDIHSRLGRVYDALGQPERSAQAFEAALALNPESPSALSHYAFTLAERGIDLDKALQMAAKATSLVPHQPEYLDAHAWVLFRLKRYKDARKQLDKALQHGGQNNPTILEHYGDVLYQLNEGAQALEYWKKARDLGSPSESLEQKISSGKM
jgi:tetratricopeptide (TPR) repeat protein